MRLTNFHTTAVCSPTRVCLQTGRNHHRVGVGMLPDLPMNFPGYTARIPDEASTLAQILYDEGYATFAVGKWHLTPRELRPGERVFEDNTPSLGNGFTITAHLGAPLAADPVGVLAEQGNYNGGWVWHVRDARTTPPRPIKDA